MRPLFPLCLVLTCSSFARCLIGRSNLSVRTTALCFVQHSLFSLPNHPLRMIFLQHFFRWCCLFYRQTWGARRLGQGFSLRHTQKNIREIAGAFSSDSGRRSEYARRNIIFHSAIIHVNRYITQFMTRPQLWKIKYKSNHGEILELSSPFLAYFSWVFGSRREAADSVRFAGHCDLYHAFGNVRVTIHLRVLVFSVFRRISQFARKERSREKPTAQRTIAQRTQPPPTLEYNTWHLLGA